MNNIVNYINWVLISPRLENDLLSYCKAEYKSSDIHWAYKELLARHKAAFLKKRA